MRYVTHQFTHVETLERARQWLVRAGIDPGRIVAHTNGVLSLAVAVEAGQAAEVQCVIDVAESSDPDGHPSFWELASQRHAYRRADAAAGTAAAFALVRGRLASSGRRSRSEPNRHRRSASEGVPGRQGLSVFAAKDDRPDRITA